MKITIESTDTLLQLDGVPVREWKGKTEAGVDVLVYVHRVAVDASGDSRQLERELKQTPEPLSGVKI